MTRHERERSFHPGPEISEEVSEALRITASTQATTRNRIRQYHRYLLRSTIRSPEQQALLKEIPDLIHFDIAPPSLLLFGLKQSEAALLCLLTASFGTHQTALQVFLLLLVLPVACLRSLRPPRTPTLVLRELSAAREDDARKRAAAQHPDVLAFFRELDPLESPSES